MKEPLGSQMHAPGRPEQQPQPAYAPMVYVSEPVVWEYKVVARDLSVEGRLEEPALNELGAEGWELAAVVVHEGRMDYVFKRVAA